jgi:predicted hydrocarbon binding protein
MKPFIVLPGQALMDLREELEIIENEEAGNTLARFGHRAGTNLVRDIGITCSLEDLEEILPQLWYEAGLSGIEVTVTEEGVEARFHDSIEVEHGRRCDFTSGYLKGMVCSLLKRRFEVVREECSPEGVYLTVLAPGEEGELPETREEGSPGLDLERGYSYLLETEDPSNAFEVFQDHLRHGARGMCISREYPEKLKKRYELGGANMLWLSYDRDISYVREPTNIPLIYSEVKNFIDDGEECIVMISGLEYMISQSNFIKVLKFIQLLNENVAVRDSLLIMPISPSALDYKEVKMLERELKILNLDG